MAMLRLKPGREKALLRRHPWIFSGAVANIQGDPAAGESIEVLDAKGRWLGRAAYSPHSNIRARIWTWDPDQTIDGPFFRERIRASLARRRPFLGQLDSNAYRELHAESDGIPGLIVDRYAAYRVVQFLSAGVEFWRQEILDALVEQDDVAGIIERSDVDVRALEGLTSRRGLLWGSPADESLEIQEHGLRFAVDLMAGQKTGFYLDQRPHRKLARMLFQGREVLNAFAYTGGFSAASLAGGAVHVTSIEISSEASEIGRSNLSRNGFDRGCWEWREADVFEALRALRDRNASFDAIILDPPRFAPTQAQVARAARGYKDINLLAFKLLRPGGILMTFSCSGGVSAELFQKIVADAALDARVDAVIQASLSQPWDHPVGLAFPEGRYLKGLVCQVAG